MSWFKRISAASRGQLGESSPAALDGFPSDLSISVPADVTAAQVSEVLRIVASHPVSRRVVFASFNETWGSLSLTLAADDPPQYCASDANSWSEDLVLATADGDAARQLVAMVGLGETRVSFHGAGEFLFVSFRCERWHYSLTASPAADCL